MPHLNRAQIQERALSLLEENPGGMRWSGILHRIHTEHPETPRNSIHGAVHKLLTTSQQVAKVARGTYQLTRFLEEGSGDQAVLDAQITVEDTSHPGRRLREEDFYAGFAEWLLENEEANEAVALGGSLLRGKWGTPDIIGVMRARANDIIKFPTQIVTAEVKIDPLQTVTALGQALAYRLFSHRTFVVLPNTVSEDDRARLKALCSLHGIGLVVFELNLDDPNFALLIPPALAEPDMFYTNQMARRLADIAPEHFHRFFS